MREIKFRAWDKENNCMVDVDFLGENVIKITNAEWENIEHFEVMQYTGLKDRTGTEIYEGDIGRWHIARGNEFILFEVLLIEEEARFMGRYRDEYDNYRFISLINPDKGSEIIGNIHENPELLELRS